MKYIVLVPDGMADYPVKNLNGRTPLDVAHTANMDFIAKNGRIGEVNTIPKGMSPGSDVANLSILGYDPARYYTGRGPFEAANLGIDLDENDVSFRCNLVTCLDEKLIDYSAGHISTKEAKILIRALDKNLGNKHVKFYSGISYRHLMVVRTDDPKDLLKVKCFPPHDITGQNISKHLPKGNSASFVLELMERSKDILVNHEINQVRIDLKENPGNMIWLWGQGVKPDMPKFYDKFGLTGAVISAVDLIKGIGKIAGLEVITVPGATGYYDTDYLAKAKSALKALRDKDFVFVHVEATDEAGHNGDLRMKIACIERFDREVVGTILKYYKRYKNFRILILPDHATPLIKRTHTSDPVCFAMYGKNISPSAIGKFNEEEARDSEFKFNSGHELIEFFLKEK